MSEDSEQFLKDAGKDGGSYMPSDDDGFANNVLKTLDDKKNAKGPTVKKAFDVSTLSPRTKAILSKMEPNERAKYSGAFGGAAPASENIHSDAFVGVASVSSQELLPLRMIWICSAALAGAASDSSHDRSPTRITAAFCCCSRLRAPQGTERTL